MTNTYHVNAGRIWRDVQIVAQIGMQEDGSITRLAYSPDEALAHQWISEQFRNAGLTVRVDAAGNIIARREGAEPQAAILTGSHLDTVPQGGRYDGVAGCIAALEVARQMEEHAIKTQRPVEFVIFAAEESPRFKSGHRFGSRAMNGLVDARLAEQLSDAQGATLAQAMHNRGLDPQQLSLARRQPGEVDAIVELHLEQGTELARAGQAAGIVTAIAGTRRYMVELEGRADHSGGTPMGQRKDALAGAAELILAVEKFASEIEGSLVGTVTMLTVTPNAMNVVPGTVSLGIDIRDTSTGALDNATESLHMAVEEICARRDLRPTITCIRNTAPAMMSSRLRKAMHLAAARHDISVSEIPSQTGHDVLSFVETCDIGMIFVRNPSGRSHSSLETMTKEDFRDATQLLLNTILQLAGESND